MIDLLLEAKDFRLFSPLNSYPRTIQARSASAPDRTQSVSSTRASDVKKGDKTSGVQRQWCGTVGKPENCMVTVHLSYATGGMEFDWIGFDEAYGGKPAFLRALDDRKQLFVGEVPSTFTGWITPPQVTDRPFQRGRGRKTPRVVSLCARAITVRNMLKYSPVLRDQPWTGYHVKDGQKGPVVWETKHAMITIKDENGLRHTIASGRRPQHGRHGRNKILPQQRAARDSGRHATAGRLFSLASRTLLSRSKTRGRPRPVGGTTLPRPETPPDSFVHQLPVPRDRP